ncbi:Alkaline phosphatase synthesis sensor protein PhoR [Candidatus Izimaplasma bacterium HR1]|uniref:HAMP domain-containing sensor histidine kinase n=1 Tax=Candidatus Izimoplasma sp. HR1 TaxID=1541959 RepID=UPI0004F6C505|nr:Alkaline phosphatase synthesis sensor protein PhoR [Candidatus Izimaplasma bacterium HR1]
MSKRKSFSQFLKDIITFIPRYYRKLSISTQLLVTFVLIFMSFFVLQTFLNNTFFKSYYAEREFEKISSDILKYVNKMNVEDSDYYNEMYQFTTENNAYSVIVDGQYRVLKASDTSYTVTVQDTVSSEFYTFIVPDNNYEYTLSETLSLDLFTYNEELYSPAIINASEGVEFTSEFPCSPETCITVSGEVTQITKPNHLNYFFEENNLIELEVSKISGGVVDLDSYEYDTGGVEGFWYRSSDGPVDTIVFVHNLKSWHWIITVIPIVNTNEIVNIISAYNYYAYLTAIVIIILWSFRISSTLSKPIQSIEGVAREIAQLNFNVEAHEYTNKENESLSNSINLISRNLKDTLETISTKNQELTDLYDTQSKQVSLKKQLVSSISHELKTPLMIMQVTIQGILDGIIEEKEQEKELNNVIQEINKSSIMIQDMLQIYRLDDANTQLEICEFDLSKTVYFFINDFENAIKKFNFDIDINIQDEVYIEADLKLIKRVISNFITNAIKYTPIGDKIYIEVSETKDEVYFELTNNGIVISEDEIDKIWLPFYRLDQEDNTRVKSKGSGIGLYLVSEILKAHQADFGITNVKNGVKAYFRLNKKVE